MRRQALALMPPLLLTITMTGCMSMDNGSNPAPMGDPGNLGCQSNYGRSYGPPKIPGVLQDSWGNNVPVQGVWAANPPGNAYFARQMLSDNQPPDKLDYYDEKTQQAINASLAAAGKPPMPVMPGGMVVPKGFPLATMFPSLPVKQAGYSPGQTGQQPNNNWGYCGNNGYYPNGYYPYYGYFNPYAGYGNSGAGSGDVIHAEIRSDGSTGNSVSQAQYTPPPAGAGYGPGPGGMGFGAGGYGGGYQPYQPYCPPSPNGMYQAAPGCGSGIMPMGGGSGQVQRMQIKFTRPNGMKVYWFGRGPDGREMYSPYPLETPGRYNFVQGATYRLKINNIEDRPLVELYPTLEVMFANAKTQDFLSHSAVPVAFTDDDFKQVAEGNYLVKVIYLPDPAYQDQAGTGIEEILSTRLDPGTDPVKEARNRGTVLLVIRMGNVEQELSHSPPLNAGSAAAGCMPGTASSGPGCMPAAPGWGNFMPGNPGYMPGAPGCPPGGCPPGGCPPGGAGCNPALMPFTFSLGGDQMPNFFNPRPLPQVPYMQGPNGPYANSPWIGQGQSCPPGYGPGMQPWCPPPYPPQGYAPWMANPGGMPNSGFNPGPLPMLGPYTPGPNPPPKGASMGDPPNKFAPNSLVHEPLDKNYPKDLPPPSPEANGQKPATDAPSTANGPPNGPANSSSLSPPLSVPGLDRTPPAVPLVGPPPVSGDASNSAAPAVTPPPAGVLGLGSLGSMPSPPPANLATPVSPGPEASNSPMPAPAQLPGPPGTGTAAPPARGTSDLGTSGLLPPPPSSEMPAILPSSAGPVTPGAPALPSGTGSAVPPLPAARGEPLVPQPSLANVVPPSISPAAPPVFPLQASAPGDAGNGVAQNINTTSPNPVPPASKSN